MLTGLQSHLEQKNQERIEKYEVMSLINVWPSLTSITSRAYLGMFAWTMPNEKTRLLWEPTHVNIGYGIETPGDVVRDYLEYKYPKRQRCTTSQYERIMKHRAFPCAALRGRYDDMVYVDLKSAYWSIISVTGWDVDYNPGRWLGVKSSILDFPLPSNKAARSSLVTAGLSSPVRVWDGEKFGWQSTNNSHINYGLWALVQDVLHGVAYEMLKLGAVYVHTDGYIIPSSQLQNGFDIIKGWGLKSGVKGTGNAEVWGVGVYKIGKIKTKRQHALPFRNHINISPEYISWLKPKFRQWSENKERYSLTWLT